MVFGYRECIVGETGMAMSDGVFCGETGDLERHGAWRGDYQVLRCRKGGLIGLEKGV